MRIVVVGAGAMGSLYGARLALAGHEVILYDTWAEHIAAIGRDGLRIEREDGSVLRCRVPATTSPPPEAASADLLLVLVKAYDTAEALQPFRKRLHPETFVLSLQNGLGNLEAMRAVLPMHERLLLGTSAHGATLLGPGRIRHAGSGPTVIGDPSSTSGPRWDVGELRRGLEQGGFQCEVAPNIHSAVWAKLISNVAINPITALTGLRNGEILDDPAITSLALAAVDEAVAVMRAAGIPATIIDYQAHARHVMELTRPNVSSMLQDIRRGRRTEIDAINGAVVRLADELGVPAPVNRWLAAMVRHRERDAIRAAQAMAITAATRREGERA